MGYDGDPNHPRNIERALKPFMESDSARVSCTTALTMSNPFHDAFGSLSQADLRAFEIDLGLTLPTTTVYFWVDDLLEGIDRRLNPFGPGHGDQLDVARDVTHREDALLTSLQQPFVNLLRGMRREVPPPVDDMSGRWTLAERSRVDRMTRVAPAGK
jgi:hypothetical protein